MRKSKVASFSIPQETWKRAEELMKVEKRSRSEIVSEAIEKYYTMRQWDELQTVGARQAKKLGIKSEEDVDQLVHAYRKNKK